MVSTLLLADGAEGRLDRGEQVPIAQYTSNTEGTVSISGYNEIDLRCLHLIRTMVTFARKVAFLPCLAGGNLLFSSADMVQLLV